MVFCKMENGKEVLLKSGAMRIRGAVQLPVAQKEDESSELAPVGKGNKQVKLFTAKKHKYALHKTRTTYLRQLPDS